MDFLADVIMDFSSFKMALSITKLASKSPLCLFYNEVYFTMPWGLGLDHDG
jgi:hypothetical protein